MATKGKKKADAQAPQPDINDKNDNPTPQLKPFIKTDNRKPDGSGNHFVRPTIPRYIGEIPGIPRHGENLPTGFDDSSCLTVGQNISLSGEITSCDKLIVEGNVEVNLTNAKMIEISQIGIFKGSATVETANINGYFEGNLEVRGVLTIQREGRVTGSVRYGKIAIESGGEISGDTASFDSVGGSAKPSGKK